MTSRIDDGMPSSSSSCWRRIDDGMPSSSSSWRRIDDGRRSSAVFAMLTWRVCSWPYRQMMTDLLELMLGL